MRRVQEDLDTAKAKLGATTFGMDAIKENDELCQHYTGFKIMKG